MKKSAKILQAIPILLVSCGGGDKDAAAPSADVVAQYRDSVLLMSDILRELPPGISSADSATLIRSIADRWIDGFLIEDLAAGQIDDLDRIERLTADYRRSLIAESYRRRMRARGVQPVDTAAVGRYYRENRKGLLLERPVVKGLFIKAAAGSRNLDDIRNWMRNPTADAYDALENVGLHETVTFRYFIDRWVDFDAVAEQIPYRFADPDNFLRGNADFETELNGTVYILHVSDYRTTGEPMPEQYAAPLIEDIMKQNNLAIYEAGLIKALRQTAIEKNILKEGSYYR